MNTPGKKHSYAVEQRLRLIDFLAFTYGYVNRAALIDYFGISGQQASLDLQCYLGEAPGNLHYNASVKAYQRADKFTRVYP